jgi:isopenicillin-N N-acyltransferase-like protein
VNSLRRYPRIRVSGSPRERGFQYGSQARDRVHAGMAGYQRAFAQSAGWTWQQAVDAVAHLVEPVQAAFPLYLAEMEGIAEGAGLDVADVFTMNARTEVMWAATARQAEADRAAYSRECSSFALLPQRTASGHTLIGQNWDWLSHSFNTLVVLEVEQEGCPNFVTLVEAGLLAKTSMNSSGLGVAVNSLVTSADQADPGLPFHVLIRAFADCDTLTDAVYIASKHQRSSSGNYLLAHSDGLAVNLETTPGGYRGVTPQLPSRGVLVHTNHFVSPVPDSQDVGHYAMADSLIRLQRIAAQVADSEAPATVEALHAALSDHADFPAAVCCHPDARSTDGLQWATVASVVMDLDERIMYLSDGNPCQYPPERLSFDGLLAKPSPLATMRESVERASVGSSL